MTKRSSSSLQTYRRKLLVVYEALIVWVDKRHSKLWYETPMRRRKPQR
jgi:hypothetical protein